MGSGGGGSTSSTGISGSGGGRIIPGTDAGPSGQFAYVTATPYTVSVVRTNNLNPTIGVPSLFMTVGVQGSAGNDVGKGHTYVLYDGTLSDGTVFKLRPSSGAGGGWGAAGGSYAEYSAIDVIATTSAYGTPVQIPGGAGGKAINTNGFAITFVGGADRIFGVVG